MAALTPLAGVERVPTDQDATRCDLWPECNPDYVLVALKALDPEKVPGCLGANTKKFWGTYPKYTELVKDATKLNKVAAFWAKLGEDVRSRIILEVKEKTESDLTTKNARAAITNKNDLCRLLHLRMEPLAQMAWTTADGTWNRAELDARKSSAAPNASGMGSLADDADPYGQLAEIFNDYETFQPQNAVIQYRNVDGVSKPMVPFRPISSEVTAIAAQCHELNPTDRSRANILRDGMWVKEQWLKIRGFLTAVFADFDRSGNMHHKDYAEIEWFSKSEIERWIYHSQNKSRPNPVVMVYSYGIMSKGDFQSLGKIMPAGTGRDATLEMTVPPTKVAI